MNQYLLYGIPLFLFFVLFEMIADAITHKNAYQFKDTLTNISLGIGQQTIEALIKTVFSIIVIWLTHYAVFRIPDTLLTFLMVVLVSDFIYYWFHRLSHVVNFLWAVHIVHHQSSEFNLSVSFRQPWLHKITAFGFFLILPILGVSPAMMFLALAFQTIYQFWLHTQFIGKLGFFEKFLVTPSHHRVHHGANPIYINKNYGNTLIVWDKLFGTFQEEQEPVLFGITKPFVSTNPFRSNIYFWKEIIKAIKREKGFWNKMKVFFQRPEDIPNDIEVKPKALLGKQPLSNGLQGYIVVQYVLIFAATIFFLFKQDAIPYLLKMISVVFILWSIYAISALMQGKKNPVLWELIRMMVFCILIYLFASGKVMH
jgi:sterol desaturase/sphingolipid hydroxylase (fatty acid hydroxylase superfamily)